MIPGSMVCGRSEFAMKPVASVAMFDNVFVVAAASNSHANVTTDVDIMSSIAKSAAR
jgi:hypothetical protein